MVRGSKKTQVVGLMKGDDIQKEIFVNGAGRSNMQPYCILRSPLSVYAAAGEDTNNESVKEIQDVDFVARRMTPRYVET